MYIILLLEGLAVHAKLFRGPPVDRDRRLTQGWPITSAVRPVNVHEDDDFCV
jgi:hypothetical protein